MMNAGCRRSAPLASARRPKASSPNALDTEGTSRGFGDVKRPVLPLPLGASGMPLQNRVTPLGELVADPARGLVYGNRGCLHDETAASAAATTASGGSPAGSSSAAGSAAAAAAGPLHRAVLPRRGDGLRRRTSPVRALPPRGLRPLRARSGASCIPATERRRRDRRAAARASGRRRRRARSATTSRRSTGCPTARSCCRDGGPRWCSAIELLPGRPPATPSVARGRRVRVVITPPSLVAASCEQAGSRSSRSSTRPALR